MSFLAFGNCRHHSMIDRADWVVKKLSKVLDLTDKQKVEVERIKKEILDKRNELNVKMIPEELVDQIRLTQIDEAKVNKVFDDNDAKRVEMRVFMTKKFIEFHAILTPDQRNKLADKIMEILKKHNHE